MRKKIVAGNWKMNLLFDEAYSLIEELVEKLEPDNIKDDVEVVVCPPYPYLEMATDMKEESIFWTGSQNVARFDNGAYTGEISAKMLAAMEVEFCIVGHSERRQYFNETDEDVRIKVEKLIQNDIHPIVCVGENLNEREAEKHFDIVKKQIEESLFSFSNKDITKIVIAYEPVWAIGTGKTATKEQAQQMHAFIRGLLADKYGELSSEISILYGGSCNASNAKELFSQPDIDGGLIGGASLKAEEFVKIAESF